MNVHSNADKATTNFIFYKSNVAEIAGVTVAALEKHFDRLLAAFEMGEPVWMIAEEMKLRIATPPKRKTPKQLAVRFVSVNN